MRSRQFADRRVALSFAVALGAAALIAGYSAVVPAFEAPDEPGHFHYVQALAAGRGLPVQGADGNYDPERSQPPLYYSIEALVAKLVPPTGAAVPTRDRQNVFQNTTARGNVNLYSHPPAEDFPWRGEVLQLHVMRLLNLVLAAITTLATFGLALELGLAPWLAIAAAATLSFLPQFDFISGALNADNLIAALASGALYLLIRWLGRPPAMWLAAGLGLTTGAAMLAKLSGLAVLPFVVAVMLWRAWRERSSAAVGQAATAGVLATVVGGWWYVRNLALFGDVLGWEPMLHAIGAMQRPQALSAFQAAAVLLLQRGTALGVFGWNNVRLPDWTYLTGDVVAGLGLLGLVVYLVHRPKPSTAASALAVSVLPLWVLMFAASLVRWVEVNTDAAQWRLLLPAFPAMAVLMIIGLGQLIRAWVVVLPVALATLSAAGLAFVVHPAYTAEQAYFGPVQHPLSVRFGERLELAGYDDPQPRNAVGGEPVSVTLYWRALQPIAEDDIIDLVGLDASDHAGWKESTWPQEGRAPTSGWRQGELVRDRHVIGRTALGPGVWNLQLDVYRPVERAPRLAIDADGDTIVNAGRFLELPPQTSPRSAQPEATYERNLALLGHRQVATPGALQVGLRWRSTGPIDRDYTVFVHLLNSTGNVLAQSDGQPAGGRFPTSLLGSGVMVDDAHTLDIRGLEAGEYRVEVGLYDAQSGQRLRLVGSQQEAFSWPVELP